MFVSGRKPGLLWSWPGWTKPSWHSLAQRNYLQGIDIFGNRVGDKARGDRRAIEMQHARELGRIDLQLVHQQRSQLTIAILLHNEHPVMLGDETLDLVVEWEAAHAHQVEADAAFLQHLFGLVHRRAGRAKIDRSQPRRLLRRARDGPRHELLGGRELLQQ